MDDKNIEEFIVYGGDYEEPKGLVSIGDVLISYLKRRGDDKFMVSCKNDTIAAENVASHDDLQITKLPLFVYGGHLLDFFT